VSHSCAVSTRELGHCPQELDNSHASDLGTERDIARLRNVSAGDVSFGCFALALLRWKRLDANSGGIDVSPGGLGAGTTGPLGWVAYVLPLK
jgi:hypothetical protein